MWQSQRVWGTYVFTFYTTPKITYFILFFNRRTLVWFLRWTIWTRDRLNIELWKRASFPTKTLLYRTNHRRPSYITYILPKIMLTLDQKAKDYGWTEKVYLTQSMYSDGNMMYCCLHVLVFTTPHELYWNYYHSIHLPLYMTVTSWIFLLFVHNIVSSCSGKQPGNTSGTRLGLCRLPGERKKLRGKAEADTS